MNTVYAVLLAGAGLYLIGSALAFAAAAGRGDRALGLKGTPTQPSRYEIEQFRRPLD